jgi:hypothetical protein
MLPAPFNPSAAQHSQILDALSDPTRSLRDIAQDHQTSTSALTIWLARPDIADQVRIIDEVSSRRLRLIAADSLPPVIAAANQVVAAFNAEEKSLTPDPKTQAKRTDHATDCRARNNAMRAANLIYRLSRFSLPTRTSAGDTSPHTPRPAKGTSPESAPDHRDTRTSSHPAPTPIHDSIVHRLAPSGAPQILTPDLAPAPALPNPPAIDALSALQASSPILEVGLHSHQPLRPTRRVPSSLTALAGLAPGP